MSLPPNVALGLSSGCQVHSQNAVERRKHPISLFRCIVYTKKREKAARRWDLIPSLHTPKSRENATYLGANRMTDAAEETTGTDFVIVDDEEIKPRVRGCDGE